MDTNRETVIERLLSGYRRYYNVTRFDGGYNPPPEEFKGICEAEKLTPPVLPGDICFNALCEYYEKAEQYFLFRHNELCTKRQSSIFFFDTTNCGQPIRKSLSFCFPFRYWRCRLLRPAGIMPMKRAWSWPTLVPVICTRTFRRWLSVKRRNRKR